MSMDYIKSLKEPVPEGHVLVHNIVRPVSRVNGNRGSRYWLEPLPTDRVPCDCGWAPEHGQHYR